MEERVAVVGSTTWGTTLGIILARKNVPVRLWARTSEEAAELEAKRRNTRFLPDIAFPDGLSVTSDVQDAVAPAGLVIVGVPSDRLRQNVRNIRDAITPGTIILSATKGLELPAGQRMSQVLKEELPPHLHPGICVLSGPNLAKEIIQGKPASTVIAGEDSAVVKQAQAILMSRYFRVYTSRDVVGVELGGALKNIIALGAGMVDGMEVGENAKSAFITRGLAEITRLGLAAGAEPLTLAGLAGLGDLIATCSSPLSRNRHVGDQLARGKTWPEIQRAMDNVAEGVNSTGAALAMASHLGVEMPIALAINRILFEGLSPQEAATELMERPPRSEW
ncbi:MAG: NAD(P)H-dependent glycerol-3-phosphate dehydrogenase [Dehalococcoidia bacterium]|nr:NAD(P)H-dependent glycerol-3-phosphate dehydrogenase [Dehalococcoidia bacterium]